MKIIRVSFLLMLILTMTLVAVSCDSFEFDPEDRKEANQINNAKNHIEDQNIEDSSESDSKKSLTAQDAERIALEHAGVAAEDAVYLYSEFEWDDGIPMYEVNFRVARENSNRYVEYEYGIHANTGKILDFERDFD